MRQDIFHLSSGSSRMWQGEWIPPSFTGKGSRGFGLLLLALLTILLAACGGGGGGSDGGAVTIQGILKRSDSREPPSESGYTVTIGGKTAPVFSPPRQNASGQDYNFEVVGVPSTATEGTVNPRQGSSDNPVSFPLPSLPNSGVVYIGEVFIGPNTEGIARATGRVVSAETGQPVAGARVTIGVFSAITTTTGTFAFPRLVAGIDKGIVEATGFERKEFAIDPPLQPGENDLGNIRLAPTLPPNPPTSPFNLRGVVSVQAPDTPVGASVVLLDAETEAQVDSLAITQPSGEFRFWVPLGRYILRVTRSGYQPFQQEVRLTAENQPLTVNVVLTR